MTETVEIPTGSFRSLRISWANKPNMATDNSLTVGIDLGTSYSALAYVDVTGEVRVVPNAQGNLLTSSVVLLGTGQKVIVGPTGNWMSNVDPQDVVIGVKRQMGNNSFFRMHEGRALSAEFLSSLILQKLRRDSEQVLGPVRRAVITVPYYFNDPCRQATRSAGALAGLDVVDILNEPTAATLAFAWSQGDLGRSTLRSKNRTVLVYDLGGGTFDVTLVQYCADSFRVIATDGDTFLGGLDWTRRLTTLASDRIREDYQFDPRLDPRCFLLLEDFCERAKCDLSQNPSTMIQFPWRDRLFSIPVTRQSFERATADLLQRTRDTTELVLDQCHLDPRDLDDVILTGGSTYMPAVQQLIETLTGKPPNKTLPPQLAVAQGAAIHAAILESRTTSEGASRYAPVWKRLRAIQTVDVNSHSLGIEISTGPEPESRQNHIMIPRNTPLPYEFRQQFFTDTANPRSIRLRLLEGESRLSDGCTVVGEFRLSELPEDLPEGSPVEVLFKYGADRRIFVTARELTGMREASVEIRWVSERPQNVQTSQEEWIKTYDVG